MNFRKKFYGYESQKLSNEENWKMSKGEIETVISVVGAMTTGFFSLITIIVAYKNAKKQIQESEKARIQQKE